MAFVLIVYRLFPLAFHAAWWLARAAQFTTSIGARAAGKKASVVEIDKLWCWASFVQFAFNCLICLKILLSGGEGRKKIKERKSHLSTWNEMHINIMRMHAMHLLCSQQPLHASISTLISRPFVFNKFSFTVWMNRELVCVWRDAF